MDLHLELLGGFQAAEVRTGGDSFLQRLEKNSLKVQHLWQAAEQRLHLTERQRHTAVRVTTTTFTSQLSLTVGSFLPRLY